MEGSKLLLPLLLLLIIFASCGSSDDDNDQQQQEQNVSGVVYDSEMAPEERQAMSESTNAITSYAIDGSRIRSFSSLFGGNTSANVAAFFDDRVNYVVSESTDIEGRLVEGSSLVGQDNQIFASNPSASLWYTSKLNEPSDVRFEVNNELVDIDSSRVGVMQIGGAFVTSETALQAATLIHEARHSDCTGGALASDLERIRTGQSPVNRLCGHLHVQCPAGHPYEGTFGCDGQPWGAYVVDLVYSLAISETCSSCSETDRQIAEINALDVLRRPVYNIEDLFNGELGPPDMSSSNEVR